jgi:MSHA pilin protein MshA
MKRKVTSTRHQGFTLIELVVVIVILGILAATAVPKFLAVDDSAKQAVVDAGKAAVQSAAVIAYTKNNGVKASFASVTPGVTLSNATVSGTCGAATVKYTGSTSITATADLSEFCS